MSSVSQDSNFFILFEVQVIKIKLYIKNTEINPASLGF